VTAALELVRDGGPPAVTLREVARRLEVSPAASYRHFADRDALLAEVGRLARRELATRMLEEVASIADPDPRTGSVRRLLAVGRGYLGFAADEPNLLAAAFLSAGLADGEVEQPNPWHILAAALDELVVSGAMPPARRAGAESIAWSAVHGFAVLRASGAFGSSGEPDPDPERLLDAIARALDVDEASI
jgi:AcrR family transcriptional regulator